ncbi:MAG: RHS repeat-associated core domain-containing protein, partial [Gemmatimonadales bacterium]
RFLSEDPIGLEGGINPLLYAGNDPVNHRDPTGLYCVVESFKYAGAYAERFISALTGLGGGAAGSSFSLASSPSDSRHGLPSCRAVEFTGNSGRIGVQTNPQGYVAWGIYMLNPARNAGPWAVYIYVDGGQVDAKFQYYPPHGSVSPKDATPGAVFHIEAEHTDLFLGFHKSVPNACIIPSPCNGTR